MTNPLDATTMTVGPAAVLFDADGVLVVSAENLRRCTARWATSHGLDLDHAFRRWLPRQRILAGPDGTDATISRAAR